MNTVLLRRDRLIYIPIKKQQLHQNIHHMSVYGKGLRFIKDNTSATTECMHISILDIILTIITKAHGSDKAFL